MRNALVYFALSSALLLLTWANWPAHMFQREAVLASKDRLAAAGQLGDSFGAYTSLISALTLAFVIYGVTIQNKQLRESQREIEDERKTRSEEASERHFFQILTLLQAHAEAMEIPPFKGIAALRANANEVFTACGRLFARTGSPAEKKKLLTEYLKGHERDNGFVYQPFVNTLVVLLQEIHLRSGRNRVMFGRLLASFLGDRLYILALLYCVERGTPEVREAARSLKQDVALPTRDEPELMAALDDWLKE